VVDGVVDGAVRVGPAAVGAGRDSGAAGEHPAASTVTATPSTTADRTLGMVVRNGPGRRPARPGWIGAGARELAGGRAGNGGIRER